MENGAHGQVFERQFAQVLFWPLPTTTSFFLDEAGNDWNDAMAEESLITATGRRKSKTVGAGREPGVKSPPAQPRRMRDGRMNNEKELLLDGRERDAAHIWLWGE